MVHLPTVQLDSSRTRAKLRLPTASTPSKPGANICCGSSITAPSTRTARSLSLRAASELLGVRPAAGRFFTDPESENVVVLSYALWQRRFGGSPRVIGSAIELDGHASRVVGVAPPRFIGAMATHEMDLWVPIVVAGRSSRLLEGLDLESRRGGLVRLVGRLAPGKRVDDAQRDLGTTAAWLAATYASNRGRT